MESGRMKKLGRVSAVRLIEVALFTVQAMSVDIFHGGHDHKNGNSAFTGAMETTRYHFYFVNET